MTVTLGGGESAKESQSGITGGGGCNWGEAADRDQAGTGGTVHEGCPGDTTLGSSWLGGHGRPGVIRLV